jgi:hypothetical protein
MLNHLMKHVLVYSAMATMLGLTPMSYAESVKFLQWWDEYFPQKFEYGSVAYGYSRKTESQQHQDVNGDGVYNDALVCKKFSLTDFLNPYPQCFSDSKKNQRYRIDRPSAQFYGGMVTRFTNVSHLTEKNKKGEDVPIFNSVGQATVQPTEGAQPNLYDPKYPENTRRLGIWGLGWADMTYHLNLYGPLFKTFDATEKAEINFSAVFLWKKEDFVNGGASANVITFDNTSKLSVDVARFRANVEECRFVVQDGNQLWISEYAYIVEGSPPATAKLNPLDSHWAIYNPSGCDIEFNREAVFIKHTFKDVQAVGVYFATYEFAHKKTGLSFDNIQVYATSKPSPEMPIEPNLIGNAIDSEGNSVSTDAKFSRGISVSSDTVTVRSSDQMDIRGVITVDSNHVGKEAEILVVVGYKPTSIEKESFFMFLKEGKILPWDGNIANLVAYEETDLVNDGDGKLVKQNIILAPERRVQLFPVTLSAFRDNELDTILLGCEERPLTYLGLLNDVPPGLLRFFFGYRLKEDGTIVYSSESINVRITD